MVKRYVIETNEWLVGFYRGSHFVVVKRIQNTD